MGKIDTKTSLIQNSNLFLHIADKGSIDISITDIDGSTFTIDSIADANFATTLGSDVDGVINRAIEIGDSVTLSHMATAANEGLTGTVTAVTDEQIAVTKTSAHTITNEAASADVNVVAFKKTYQFVEAGDLSFVDGCMGIILASKLVDMWDTLDLDKYLRPFTSIEPRAKSLASLNGWEPHDLSTINAIRDTALEIRTIATASADQIYHLFRSGDLKEATDQFKVWPSSQAELDAPFTAVMTGYINQLFKTYDSAGDDNRFSNGVTWFTRCAEQYKTIVMEEHEVDYAEIMPVSAANDADPKLIATDVSISGGGVWLNIDVTDDTIDYDGDVDSVIKQFDRWLEGDSQYNQTVHEKINWLLRQTSNINQGDAGDLRGDKQWPITTFSGNVFTIQGYLVNYKASQRNDLRVVDTSGVTWQWPSSMTLSVAAAAIAVGGTFTVYHTNTYGTDNAVLFQNESSVEQRDIPIELNVDIVMAFSSYTVDGHTGGDNLPVTIAFNKPGSIEPDIVEVVLAGTNITATISAAADPSYIA